MAQYIVYACPTGDLAEQIQAFFQQSRADMGANTAHQYMPHCSLTGFFEDRAGAVPLYTQALDRAYKRAYPARPSSIITVQGLTVRSDWQGLELESPWLQQLIVDFACTAVSPTRQRAVRPKTWLHLSLAYGFAPGQAKALSALAAKLIDVEATVAWQLRFYQRHLEGHWTCHRSWPLDS